MATGTVQECGCIALPEELQEKTGLYPGAKFQFEVAEDGVSLVITSIERATARETGRGVSCGVKA